MFRSSGSVVSPILIGGLVTVLLAGGATVVIKNRAIHTAVLPLAVASQRPVVSPIPQYNAPTPRLPVTPSASVNQSSLGGATLAVVSPTLQVFSNASISFDAGTAKVMLKSGLQCTTSVEGEKLITSDFVGDGGVEAAVPLKTNCGGTGTFHQLVITRLTAQTQGALLASVDYGDRNQINSLSVGTRNTLIVDATVHGPNDSACCATVHQLKTYKLQSGSLVEIPAQTASQPLNLDDVRAMTYETTAGSSVTLVGGKALYMFQSGLGKDGQPVSLQGSLAINDTFTSFGDVDGSGSGGAIVMLSENIGGTGYFYKLAAVSAAGGVPKVLAYGGSKELGDRPTILAATLMNGIYTVTTGLSNNSPAGTYSFKLQNNALIRVN